MTTLCPNGHDSEWPDWCSVCGERIGAAAAETPPKEAAASAAAASTPLVQSPPVASGPTCENCGVARHEHDVFCESCGYDFASGSLPEDDSSTENANATRPPVHAKVFVDADFFAASAGEADLTLPDPLPEAHVIPLPGIRILIGRQSNSRGVYPELDIRALTEDPAVSTQHGLLERDGDNQWTLTDLGSTNGTFLTAAADEAIEPGVALPIEMGTSIYLGAWTRIELAQTT